MVPRTEIIALPVSRRSRSWRVALRHRHSRLPGVRADHRQRRRHPVDQRPASVAGASGARRVATVRPAAPVSGAGHRAAGCGRRGDRSAGAYEAARQPMAVVLDEFGGKAGIVTLKDLVRRACGQRGRRIRLGDARVSARSADGTCRRRPGAGRRYQRRARHPLRRERGRSLGGLVFSRLGRRPRVGDEVEIGSQWRRASNDSMVCGSPACASSARAGHAGGGRQRCFRRARRGRRHLVEHRHPPVTGGLPGGANGGSPNGEAHRRFTCPPQQARLSRCSSFWASRRGLRQPVLLAGFSGWGDAGSAATIALRHVLGEATPPARRCSIPRPATTSRSLGRCRHARRMAGAGRSNIPRSPSTRCRLPTPTATRWCCWDPSRTSAGPSSRRRSSATRARRASSSMLTLGAYVGPVSNHRTAPVMRRTLDPAWTSD